MVYHPNRPAVKFPGLKASFQRMQLRECATQWVIPEREYVVKSRMMTNVTVVGQIIHENAADSGVTLEVIMTAAALSSHIPDLNLITYYAEKHQSFFSRFSPWTKFAFLIIIVLLVTLTGNLTILAVLYLIILIAYAAAHL